MRFPSEAKRRKECKEVKGAVDLPLFLLFTLL